MSVHSLPTLEISGKTYFADARLSQFRNVQVPFDVIPMGEGFAATNKSGTLTITETRDTFVLTNNRTGQTFDEGDGSDWFTAPSTLDLPEGAYTGEWLAEYARRNPVEFLGPGSVPFYRMLVESMDTLEAELLSQFESEAAQ
jgi:hypothetical protein